MDAGEMKCTVAGCKRPYRAKGFCNVHFHKWRRGEMGKKPRYKICKEEKCRKPMYRGGYCESHYEAWIAAKKGKGEMATQAKLAETPPSAG